MTKKTHIDLGSYWEKSIDYTTYLENIEQEIEKKDSFLNYYTLNLKRMNRLNKKFSLGEDDITQINAIDKKIDILIITEGWCGDAAQIVPIIHKMVETSENLNMKLIYRDQNEELINAYLTNGGKAIPIIIGLDHETKEELFRWGPRPAFGNELLEKYRAGEMSKEYFQLNLQKTYNSDKGKSIVQEILNKIK